LLAFLLFFFFQAEDGIRDFHVTGVQTCALPICRRWSTVSEKAKGTCRPSAVKACRAIVVDGASARLTSARVISICAVGGSARRRSEERRVGKECRAR